MPQTVKTPNRLINEKSPYLLQHAHNPVNWFPWGDEAFEKAKKEDKPVFLSIGYSTCHWCHVMERESFEDQEVAKILNEHFVSIKVDREERPDIDTIYMSVCQAMTGHGGWPLTVIMTPDKKPFFAGTYYPKHSSRGMPGLMDILTQITSLWEHQREKLVSSGDEVTRAVQKSLLTHTKGVITEDALHKAFKHFEHSFDTHYGGFGRAPKFPTPHNLSFLLRYWKMTGRSAALEMVEKTLDSMYLGGIYDHVGFGFSRYSTDKKWLVPHFEKMLYDNALLAIAYLEAFQATGYERFAKAAREIFTYVLRDMTSPEGAFYSAEDADSEGEEGKFYVWTPDEIKQVLGEELGTKYCTTYDITKHGNFEGKNIPNLIENGYVSGFEDAGKKLFEHREHRVHPFKDDKFLTSWNGLMIAAMAFGSRVLNEPEYSNAAERAAQFILKHLKRADGRLMARYRDGQVAHLGYVDDYAFLIWGLIELYQATFNNEYLKTAHELNKDMLKLFWDKDEGGLFLYGSDAETLIMRPKELYDGAIPSGNSVAAVNFLRLARLTGDPNLEETAKSQFEAFGGSVNEVPMGHTHFLMAAFLDITPPIDIALAGEPGSEDLLRLAEVINNSFRPNLIVSLNQSGKTSVDGKAAAYVCKDFSCLPPVTEQEQLIKMLD